MTVWYTKDGYRRYTSVHGEPPMTDADKVEVLYEAAREAIDLMPHRDDTHDARTRLADALKEVDQ